MPSKPSPMLRKTESSNDVEEEDYSAGNMAVPRQQSQPVEPDIVNQDVRNPKENLNHNPWEDLLIKSITGDKDGDINPEEEKLDHHYELIKKELLDMKAQEKINDYAVNKKDEEDLITYEALLKELNDIVI